MHPYVSIDIETTGLDPQSCQILEIGMVIDHGGELHDLPTWHCYVVHPVIHGDPYALSMHGTILRRIATREEGFLYLDPFDVPREMSLWLREFGMRSTQESGIQAAGKNFASFDKQFLERLPGLKGWVKFKHRSIDPGNLFWRPQSDKELPGSKTCMERAGIAGEVAHTAVADAMAVIQMVRAYAALRN